MFHFVNCLLMTSHNQCLSLLSNSYNMEVIYTAVADIGLVLYFYISYQQIIGNKVAYFRKV